MAKWALALVILAALLWSGWWVVGARATAAALEAALIEAEREGWTVAREDVSVSGFPNRFDVTLEPVAVVSPGGWAVSAPIARAFALAYRPTHVIAVAPPVMAVTGPAGSDVAVTSEDLRASVVVSAATSPVLERMTFVAEALRLDGGDWDLGLARGQVATRQAAGPSVHDVAVTLTGLALPGAGPLDVEADAVAAFDRGLGAGQAPRLDTLTLRSMEVLWGEVEIRLSGEASVRSTGLLGGDFTLTAQNWAALLAAAADAGLIPAGQVPLLSAGLRGLEDETGRAAVPIRLEDGVAQVLGFPIARLPRLPVPGG